MTRTSFTSTLLMIGLLSSAAPGAAQHSLESASALYASARYEEALAVLDRLTTNGDAETVAVKIDVEIHRALCLLALGPDDDAGAAFARVVSTRPWYRLDPKQVSPSVGTFYRTVRKKALPDIAQTKYVEARPAYDRKDFALALETFKVVRALFDDEDMEGVSPDVNMLASEFQLLARAQVPPAPDPGSRRDVVSREVNFFAHPTMKNKCTKWGRRDFLKMAGLLTAGIGLSPLPVMAGPFAPEDWNQYIPVDKKLHPDWVKSLFERGQPAVYRKSRNELRYIGMPVGGICCGTLYLGGDGKLWNWDIFNQKTEGVLPRRVKWSDVGMDFQTGDNAIRPRDGATYVKPAVQEDSQKIAQGFASGRKSAAKRRPARSGERVHGHARPPRRAEGIRLPA